MTLRCSIEARGDRSSLLVNPPTTGHGKLIDALARESKRKTLALRCISSYLTHKTLRKIR